MQNYTGKHVTIAGTVFYYLGDWDKKTSIYSAYFHRLDGPAIEHSDGRKSFYYKNDKIIREQDYWQHPDVLKYKMIQEAKALLGIKNE